MQIELSPLAEADLESIGDYIALDSPGNALRFILSLRDQCQKIALHPWLTSPDLSWVTACAVAHMAAT